MNPFAGIIFFDKSKVENSQKKIINSEINLNNNFDINVIDKEDIYLAQASHSRNSLKTNILYSEKTSEYYLFNGRIDNREEIKKYLNINNSSLQDSEIFLNFFLKEGKKCLQKIHGSFAATIINNKSKSAICIKDHIGSKPLFFQWIKIILYSPQIFKQLPKFKKINYK